MHLGSSAEFILRSHDGKAHDAFSWESLVADERRPRPPLRPFVTRPGGRHVSYQAEYIWIDGTEPSPLVRCKTRVLATGKDPGQWGFDGSSTNQAPGHNSDCTLNPVFTCPDPIRGGDNLLVLCDVGLPDGSPHATNTRAACVEVATRYAGQEPMFGIEQEYTFFKNGAPLGWPEQGYPAPQGPYYCGVGGARMVGRDIIEKHTLACIDAGLAIEGTNAEVMMGQWEFQIGVLAAPDIGDQVWIARWLLYRIAEPYQVEVSLAAKPMPGDWNGAGAHTNFSTNAMRESYDAIVIAAEALGERALEHIDNYGSGIRERLTGAHETARWDTFSWGASDRGASVRIPWAVEKAKKGWLEDRRPNANMDPYVVTRMIMETCCSALDAKVMA
jgi:glutamine synthetase